MTSVWGSDVIVTSRSVDRCAATCAQDRARPARPTHSYDRDIGYRFEAPEPILQATPSITAFNRLLTQYENKITY
jgi:hypothetical protein